MTEKTKKWLQFSVCCKAEEAERISDLLFEHGAFSVVFEDAADLPIFEPPPDENPLWETVQVIALFDSAFNVTSLETAFSIDFPTILHSQQIAYIDDQPWEKAYLAYFEPLQISENLWICPNWCEPPEPKVCNVFLDPGLAFGTGSHPTTQLCLQLLAAQSWFGKTLIDYGCGSGILGITALKLGAKHVYALDIHPQAAIATRQNAENNGLTEKDLSIVAAPKNLPHVPFLVANILASTLVELAPQLISLLEKKGFLLLSGILIEQVEMVLSAYPDFACIEKCEKDEWAAVLLQR